MYSDVPQPTAHTRRPGAGRRSATSVAIAAARRHAAGWLAISSHVMLISAR
jgi:hypothetical protein